MRRLALFIVLLAVASLACNLTRNPIEATPIPPTQTPDATGTALAQQPTFTPTSSPTPSPTATQTITPSPTLTLTPSITPTPRPSSTPYPTVALQSEVTSFVAIPTSIQEGLDVAWVAFTVTENQTTPEDTETVIPKLAVYLAHPSNGILTRVIELPEDARVYWSPTGLHVAYVLREGEARGLYLLDIQSGRVMKIHDSNSLQPRGINGNQPVWSPDGTRLAFVLPNDYATDIYIINADGTGLTNLTNDYSYDFWPTWSTDSLKLAFVSDRVQCPTWQPNHADSCDRPDATPPQIGNLFVYRFDRRRVEQITETIINAPPEWVTADLVNVSEGSLDPFSDVSNLWVFDVGLGATWRISPNDGALYSQPAWTRDGTKLLYHRVTDEDATLIMADWYGNVLASQTSYDFVRFGMKATWSPDGRYVAIGGSSGQCPYGLLVFDANFALAAEPSETLLACDPNYDPTGTYVLFNGIQLTRGTDGRRDIYTADLVGGAARNLTRTIEGFIQVQGWVGPTFSN